MIGLNAPPTAVAERTASPSTTAPPEQADASALTPLRIRAFRALWLASLVGMGGAWFQTVGAQWLLVGRPHASLLVSLVLAASMLPYVLFGLIAGVLADTLDRRRLLIAVQLATGVAGAALALLAQHGPLPPWLLVGLVFATGTGAALTAPAYQSLLPQLVPRQQIPAAAALNSIGVNVARAGGPAVAGVLVSTAGVAATFAVASATALTYAAVVAFSRPQTRSRVAPPEPPVSALRAGARYVRHAPVIRRILARGALFLVPASAVFALLPLIAAERLSVGSGGYGILLSALGIGAVAGAFVLRRIRGRFSTNVLVAGAGGVFAVVLVGLVLVREPVAAALILLPAGVAWVVVLSSLNASLQLFLPAWVRGRSLAAYTTVLFGSQALGALLFGLIAGVFGLVVALLAAAAMTGAAAATIRIWPFVDTRDMNRDAVVNWQEPRLHPRIEADARPTLVSTTYRVAEEDEAPFVDAMARVRQSRLRTGATTWGLYRDTEDAELFVELFTVRSWEEHLRQHRERQTGTDHDDEERADQLSEHVASPKHLIAVTT